MVQNPPASVGDTGWIPGLGRVHVPQSNQTCEPQLLKPEHLELVPRNKRSHCKERSPLFQVEKACTQQQRACPAKKKKSPPLCKTFGGNNFLWLENLRVGGSSCKHEDFNDNYLSITTASTAAAKPLQSCPTLCDPIDSSPPGSPVPGILQARPLEWVAISFSIHGIFQVGFPRQK